MGITPRFSNTSHIIGDKLIVVVGVGYGDTPPPCEVIDLITGHREVFNLPSEVDGELLMCHNHSSFIVNNSLWIIGGGGNCFSFGTHYNKMFKISLENYL